VLDRLLDYLTVTASFLFFGYAIIIFVQATANRGFKSALLVLFSQRILIPLVLVLGLNFLSIALVFIKPPAAGVVISLVSSQGVREKALDPGLHWIIPFVEEVEIYTVAWQTYTMANNPLESGGVGDDSIRARTSDGQEVRLACSLIFRLDPERAIEVYSFWQKRYIQELMRPLTRGLVRTQVSQFTADEVNSSSRKDLEAALDQLLRDKLEEEGFILNEFILRDIAFTPEYSASIEKKQVSLEEQTQSEYEAEQIRRLAKGRADALLIEAEAQAQAFKLLGEALALNPDLLTLEYIKKLSPNIKVMLVPNNSPFILPLPELEERTPPTRTLQLPLPTQTVTATPTLDQP
jgi:regulator of protease activity HflC (stomatin/prohibitin superfamily)